MDATAILLDEKGAKVVVGARRKDYLEELVACIASKGGTASYQVTDVTKRSDVENLVKYAVAANTYGKVDVRRLRIIALNYHNYQMGRCKPQRCLHL